MSDELRPEQRAALDRLVERNVLSHQQLRAVFDALEAGQPARTRGEVWEIVGYIGGTLVLGGVILLVSTRWHTFSHDTRVGLLIAATLILLGAAAFVGGGPRGLRALARQRPSARTRTVATLHVLGSIAAALTVGTAASHTEHFFAALAGFLVGLLGFLVLPSEPGLLATGVFSAGAVLTAVGEWFSSTALAYAGWLGLLGVAWVVLALVRALPFRATARVMGTLLALAATQWAVGSDQPWWGYGSAALLAVLCFVSSATGDKLLLAPGVLALTLAVPEAVWDWTEGSVGGSLVVLICGVTFLVAAALGMRLRRSGSTR